jgi:hypothetical protein
MADQLVEVGDEVDLLPEGDVGRQLVAAVADVGARGRLVRAAVKG